MRKLILTLLLAFASSSAMAGGSLNCGNSIISIGDTKAELLLKCGSPVSVDEKTEITINQNGFKQPIKVGDILLMDQGKYRFMVFVTVENGVITHVEDGPRHE